MLPKGGGFKLIYILDILALCFCFPFLVLVRADNPPFCTPAENSTVLWLCLKESESTDISLISGQQYTIQDPHYIKFKSNLTIVSTDAAEPAILFLNDMSSQYGLFSGDYSTGITINNIDIRANGTGVFLQNIGNIFINNCRVSGYRITSPDTAFIKHAQTLKIHNTIFYDNTVASQSSNFVNPAFMIGTWRQQWNISISECKFENNYITNSLSNTPVYTAINLFFYVSGFYYQYCDGDDLNDDNDDAVSSSSCSTVSASKSSFVLEMNQNNHFQNNKINGSGSAFALIQTSFEQYIAINGYSIQIANSTFTENEVHQEQVGLLLRASRL